MDILKILTNPVLIVPGCAWVIAQILKLIINTIMTKEFSIERLFGDGGMPSGHSSIVTALAVSIGLFKGFDTAEFAIAFIFAAVVMRDAMGVRLETGKQAASIIKIADLLNDYFTEYDDKIRTDKLKVLVGHTPLQVVCGSILGAVVSIIFYIVYLSLI
jgi:acid phosphatase family membrane protein YuiD